MRFMMLMIPKGYERAKPGTMPDPKAVAAMMKYNEVAPKSRRAARTGWTAPGLGGGARLVLGRGKPKVTDGPFAENQGSSGRILDDSGAIEGRGDRMGETLPRFGKRSRRGSASDGDVGVSLRRPGGCGRVYRIASQGWGAQRILTHGAPAAGAGTEGQVASLIGCGALECVQLAAAFAPASLLAGTPRTRDESKCRSDRWSKFPQASLREGKRQQAARTPKLRSVC